MQTFHRTVCGNTANTKKTAQRAEAFGFIPVFWLKPNVAVKHNHHECHVDLCAHVHGTMLKQICLFVILCALG